MPKSRQLALHFAQQAAYFHAYSLKRSGPRGEKATEYAARFRRACLYLLSRNARPEVN